MKLDYKVLWLDDKINDFIDDEYLSEIVEHLTSEEFNPIIHFTDKQDEFFDYLKNNSYDLILTDFHLNENANNKDINGDNIVEAVRNENNIFTEILFYTARADLKGSLTWDRISFLETANLPDNHHEEVIKKVKKMIDLTIEKFHDIVVMRGMIMNETSTLDSYKLNLLYKFMSSEKYEKETNNLKDTLFSDIAKFLEDKSIDIAKYRKNDNFNKLLKDTVLFSSSKKILAMSEILKVLHEDDFSSDYAKEIISTRNKFAHAELIEEDGRKYFSSGKDGITFDNQYCKDIRRNINKHKNNLDKLKTKLDE